MMEKFLPLHSLVISIGSSELNFLKQYEILDPKKIMYELVGENRPELDAIVHSEMRHRVNLKLSLGERVILRNIPFDQRASFIKLAEAQGASINYIVNPNEKDIPDGNIFTISKDIIIPVTNLPHFPLKQLQKHFKGITIIGDIHGMIQPMKDALIWAKSRNHFVYMLGDVIDYGANSLDVMDLAYKTVMCGEGSLILGNHEKKIAKWLSSENAEDNVRLSDGNKVTLDALNQLSPLEKAQWIGRFRSLLGKTSLFAELGNFVLVHAATHPHFWSISKRNEDAIENSALYGETNTSMIEFTRSYSWVDSIPAGKTVIVGHDIRSNIPLNILGAKGGRAIFMDTGCGKGGKLSSCDIRFGLNNTMRIENFNIH